MKQKGSCFRKEWMIIALMLVFTSCSINRLPNTSALDQISLEQSRQSSLSPKDALELAEKDIDSAKKEALSEAIQVLQSAKKIDAKKLAPKTWKIAEDTLKQSTEFIQSYPRDEEGVKKAGLDALRASQHVFFVTKETLALKETDKDSFENVVLDMENKLGRIALGLNHPDVRYMSLYDQSVVLGTAAEVMSRNVVISGKNESPIPLSSVKENIETAPTIISEPVSVVSETPAKNEDPVDSVDNTPEISNEPVKVSEEEKAPDKTDSEPEASQSVSDIPQTNAPEKDIESIKNELEEIEKKL